MSRIEYSGASEVATGTINNGSASLLSFTATKRIVVVCNTSGQRAYFKINDPSGSQLVSATVRDFALDDGDTASIEGFGIRTLGVFVAATSGVTATGW